MRHLRGTPRCEREDADYGAGHAALTGPENEKGAEPPSLRTRLALRRPHDISDIDGAVGAHHHRYDILSKTPNEDTMARRATGSGHPQGPAGLGGYRRRMPGVRGRPVGPRSPVPNDGPSCLANALHQHLGEDASRISASRTCDELPAAIGREHMAELEAVARAAVIVMIWNWPNSDTVLDGMMTPDRPFRRARTYWIAQSVPRDFRPCYSWRDFVIFEVSDCHTGARRIADPLRFDSQDLSGLGSPNQRRGGTPASSNRPLSRWRSRRRRLRADDAALFGGDDRGRAVEAPVPTTSGLVRNGRAEPGMLGWRWSSVLNANAGSSFTTLPTAWLGRSGEVPRRRCPIESAGSRPTVGRSRFR